jgi:hypothetical protein
VPISVSIVGSRLASSGVSEIRDHVLALAARKPVRLGIFTAYFGSETFPLLDDLAAAGAHAIEIVLAENGAARSAWEAASGYSNSAVALRVARSSPGSVLHPKLIVAEDNSRRSAIIGSSNFSAGGFWANVELNVALEESSPFSSASAVASLHQIFQDMFSTAVPPTPAVWSALIAAAPVRTPTRARVRSSQPPAPVTLPIIGTAIASVGAPQAGGKTQPQMPRTQPSASPPQAYNTLLLQLSDADVNRPVWQPTGVGTSQMNLPRQALAPLRLSAAYVGSILVEAVGVGAYAGTTETHEAGLWQRDPRGPGRIPEAARFTFKQSLKEFIRDDTGSPAVGDVCVIEVPAAGISTANPMRVAVIPAAVAAAIGALPTAHGRGTRASQPLFWEVRTGTVL